MTRSNVDSLLKELVESAAQNERTRELDAEDVEGLARTLLAEQFSPDRKDAQAEILESITTLVERLMEAEKDET